MSSRPILTFTDFGFEGSYLGEMKLAILRIRPDAAVIDLMADAPAFRPKESAYLLAALATRFPEGAVCLGVVDPGVGGDRPGIAVQADGRWFVGPGNGLFEIATRRSGEARAWELPTSSTASPSFHGRDVFAPVAARLSQGLSPDGAEIGGKPLDFESLPGKEWPDDLDAVIYFDRYGNALTGRRAKTLRRDSILEVEGAPPLAFARVFSDAPAGAAFWYENSSGLVEIAVNGGSARERLRLSIGSPVHSPSATPSRRGSTPPWRTRRSPE